MPIYEYHCNACSRTVSVFQRSMNATVLPRCDGCGGADLARLMSKFAFRKSAGDGLDADGFDQASLIDGLDEDDPDSVARWARRMGDQMGEDLPPEFDQMAGQMGAGGMPGNGFGDDGGFDDDF